MWPDDRRQLQNPVLTHFMGLCPVLAVTNTVYNALGMALATSAVLLPSAVLASCLRHCIPRAVRIPAYVTLVASLVSSLDILLRAYAPELSRNLGAFVLLIVVNCLILGQIESFSSKNPPLPSLRRAAGAAAGFTLALVLVALVRELLGTGSITVAGRGLWPLPQSGSLAGLPFRLYRGQIQTPFSPALGGKALRLLVMPAGALLVIGYLGAAYAWLAQRFAVQTKSSKPKAAKVQNAEEGHA